jgi:hypothetical protein
VLFHDTNLQSSIIELVTHHDIVSEVLPSGILSQRRDSPKSIAKPVRPFEFSLWMAFPFLNLFIVLAISLGVVFAKARINGRYLHQVVAEPFVVCGILLMRPRIAHTFLKYHCTKHPRKLHPDSHSYLDRAGMDSDQPSTLHVTASGGVTEL